MGSRGLADFLARTCSVVRVALTEVRGSSPRNAGTEMFVAADDLHGTIGGGKLEFMVIARAREMLADGSLGAEMTIPLGPEIGQCCGGRVSVSLVRMRRADKHAAIEGAEETVAQLPQVLVLGAGHVGRALAMLFQHLPVQCVLVDSRAGELARCCADVEKRLSAIPEADIAAAPEGSAFIVLTHDHALDFLLTSAALERGDATYVGMIGSATKRVKFRNWARGNCDGLGVEGLTCPIGATGSQDKRPELIAAFVVAEVMGALTRKDAAAATPQKSKSPMPGVETDTRRRPAS